MFYLLVYFFIYLFMCLFIYLFYYLFILFILLIYLEMNASAAPIASPEREGEGEVWVRARSATAVSPGEVSWLDDNFYRLPASKSSPPRVPPLGLRPPLPPPPSSPPSIISSSEGVDKSDTTKDTKVTAYFLFF